VSLTFSEIDRNDIPPNKEDVDAIMRAISQEESEEDISQADLEALLQ